MKRERETESERKSERGRETEIDREEDRKGESGIREVAWKRKGKGRRPESRLAGRWQGRLELEKGVK